MPRRTDNTHGNGGAGSSKEHLIPRLFKKPESKDEEKLRKAKEKFYEAVKKNPDVELQIADMISRIRKHESVLKAVIDTMNTARTAMSNEKVGETYLKAELEDLESDFTIANGIIGAMVEKLQKSRKKREEVVNMLNGGVAQSIDPKAVMKTRDFIKSLEAN